MVVVVVNHCLTSLSDTLSSRRIVSRLTIGRVTPFGDCSMCRSSYIQKVLCSENIYSKVSMFRGVYIQKLLYSEDPMFRRFLKFRLSYVQKVLCSENICSKSPIIRRLYVQKVLHSDMFKRSYVQKIVCFMREQFQVKYNKDNKSILSF